VWQRYHGVVAQGALFEAMARCDTFVFQDSRNQLCIRDPISFDYVVLDDVGVVYVYSDDAMFRDVLEALGLKNDSSLSSARKATGRKRPWPVRNKRASSYGFCGWRLCRDLVNLGTAARSIDAFLRTSWSLRRRLRGTRADSVDCRLQIADCRLQIADCRLQIADCRLLIADC